MTTLYLTFLAALVLGVQSLPVHNDDPRLALDVNFGTASGAEKLNFLKTKLADHFPSLVQDIYQDLSSYMDSQNSLVDLVLSLDDNVDMMLIEGGYLYEMKDSRQQYTPPSYCLVTLGPSMMVNSWSDMNYNRVRRAATRGYSRLNRYSGQFRRLHSYVDEIAHQIGDVIDNIQVCSENMTTVRKNIAAISEIIGADVWRLLRSQTRSCVGLYGMANIMTEDYLPCKSVSRCIMSLKSNGMQMNQKTKNYQMETNYMKENCDLITKVSKELRKFIEESSKTYPDLVQKYFYPRSRTPPQ